MSHGDHQWAPGECDKKRGREGRKGKRTGSRLKINGELSRAPMITPSREGTTKKRRGEFEALDRKEILMITRRIVKESPTEKRKSIPRGTGTLTNQKKVRELSD